MLLQMVTVYGDSRAQATRGHPRKQWHEQDRMQAGMSTGPEQADRNLVLENRKKKTAYVEAEETGGKLAE